METRPIIGLSKYLAREDGEVISHWGKAPRPLAGGTDKDGYRKMVLIDDAGNRRHVRRASLVCEAFHGPRPAKMVVMHLDGSRTNDAPANLSWGTQSQNCLDKWKHGTAQVGSRNNRAVLTEDDVRYIRSNPDKTGVQLAKELGKPKSAVYQMRTGRSWKWLT
jgi:hypothetical protein